MGAQVKKLEAKKGEKSCSTGFKQASDAEVYRRADEGKLNSARVIERAEEGKLEALGDDKAQKKIVADVEKQLNAQIKKLEGKKKSKAAPPKLLAQYSVSWPAQRVVTCAVCFLS